MSTQPIKIAVEKQQKKQCASFFSSPPSSPAPTRPKVTNNKKPHAVAEKKTSSVKPIPLSSFGSKKSALEQIMAHRAALSLSATDDFSTELSKLPEATTLDAYRTVPVEHYGEALLRGMGWKGE